MPTLLYHGLRVWNLLALLRSVLLGAAATHPLRRHCRMIILMARIRRMHGVTHIWGGRVTSVTSERLGQRGALLLGARATVIADVALSQGITRVFHREGHRRVRHMLLMDGNLRMILWRTTYHFKALIHQKRIKVGIKDTIGFPTERYMK